MTFSADKSIIKLMEVNDLKNSLQAKNLTDVSSRTGLTRQTLHNFLKGKNATLKTLNALESYFHDEETEKLYQSLAYYGAPLAVKNKYPHFSLQVTLQKALVLSKTEELVASTMPYLFFKQRANLNLEELLRDSVKSSTDNLLGYFLDSANEFRSYNAFKSFTDKMKKLFLYDSKHPTKFNGEVVATEFLPVYTRNKTALSWGLLDRGDFKHHLDRFEKWLAQDER